MCEIENQYEIILEVLLRCLEDTTYGIEKDMIEEMAGKIDQELEFSKRSYD